MENDIGEIKELTIAVKEIAMETKANREDVNKMNERLEKIKELLHIENIVSIQNEKVDKRDKLIAQIARLEGIERKQLARILGMNERTIYRAMKKEVEDK